MERRKTASSPKYVKLLHVTALITGNFLVRLAIWYQENSAVRGSNSYGYETFSEKIYKKNVFNRISRNPFPGTNIDQVKETTDAKGKTTYHYYFEAVTNFNHNSEVTVHVLSTKKPLFDTAFDYGSYAVTGKMRTYHMNGTIMCLDAFLHEGIDKDDCWYDVRAMGNQPLCPKKRKFFNVANHADVMVSNQASYIIYRLII